MIYATYQPLKPTSEECPEAFAAVEKHLGFRPIWCVSADTAEKFAFWSWWCASSMPEKLIIFESDKAIPYDAVKWRALLGKVKGGAIEEAALEECFNVSDPRYSEYVVEEIDPAKVIAAVDIRKLIFEEEFGDATVRKLQELMKIEYGNFVEASPNADAKLKAMALKGIFVSFMSRLLWHFAQGKKADVLGCMPLTPDPGNAISSWKYEEAQRLCGVVSSGGSEDAYADFNRMRELLESCQQDRYESWVKAFFGEVGRNDACPCGSGAKFKKCHETWPGFGF